jgi:hypothetical protein
MVNQQPQAWVTAHHKSATFHLLLWDQHAGRHLIAGSSQNSIRVGEALLQGAAARQWMGHQPLADSGQDGARTGATEGSGRVHLTFLGGDVDVEQVFHAVIQCPGQP